MAKTSNTVVEQSPKYQICLTENQKQLLEAIILAEDSKNYTADDILALTSLQKIFEDKDYITLDPE